MAAGADDVTMTFGGNATMLLRIGAFTVLTDPSFVSRGTRVYLGYGLRTRRLTDPALQPADLPPLDAVVLSHLHGDHWDDIATDTARTTRAPATSTARAPATGPRGRSRGVGDGTRPILPDW